MNRDQSRESARIYQFPAGGRAALGFKHREELTPVGTQTATRVNEAACSESWYHEAAIREAAERSRDH